MGSTSELDASELLTDVHVHEPAPTRSRAVSSGLSHQPGGEAEDAPLKLDPTVPRTGRNVVMHAIELNRIGAHERDVARDLRAREQLAVLDAADHVGEAQGPPERLVVRGRVLAQDGRGEGPRALEAQERVQQLRDGASKVHALGELCVAVRREFGRRKEGRRGHGPVLVRLMLESGGSSVLTRLRSRALGGGEGSGASLSLRLLLLRSSAYTPLPSACD